MNTSETYTTDECEGAMWKLLLGDSCERLSEIETESIDLSICSPPFDSLYTYSPTLRDLGNSANRAEFIEHYKFIIREQLRVTKPGRNACIHVQQIATKKAVVGYVGMTDFRGDVIRAFQDEGWIYYGEATIWKDPQAQSIRTKSFALSFKTKNRDSAATRPALADYLLIFKKPGQNMIPIKHEPDSGEVTNDNWIDWASPIWFDISDGGDIGGANLAPIWQDIRETTTLNVREGRESEDERHIAPLQLDFIDRCVRLWSNPGEVILTPFAGIGSEVYVSVKRGRIGIGIELKPSYWQTAVKNLQRLDAEMSLPVLFEASTTTDAT